MRQEKYNRVWATIGDTWESARITIEKMLLLLTDAQLDELLEELEKRT